MQLATVVIVGRPNVGKSSFFNRVLGRRAAVVANRDGVTRDRHYQVAEWNGHYFTVVDTGGFLSKDLDGLNGSVRKQIEVAVAEADVVLFLADGRVGITELDQTFARVIQKSGRPVILVVNKAESRNVALESSVFWNLGLGEPFPISALQGDNVADLLDKVLEYLPTKPRFVPREDKIKVAILGRPNAGKSTMVNALIGEDRVITSAIPGTTRDAIDTEFEWEGRKFVLTDTAGLRRKARVKDEVEYFSNMRALEAIRRSDVCVLLVDALRGMEIQDHRICTLIQEVGKGLIVCLNKWDIVEPGDKTFDHMVKALRQKNPDLEGMPFLSASGLTGKRLVRVLEEIVKVKDNLGRVLGRENVIRYLEETVSQHPHPATSLGPVNLERCCQVLVNPPALAFEISHPERIQTAYVRYLRRRAYEFFQLEGAPIRIWFRSRFKLRTDEDLLSYLHWGNIPEEVRAEWADEEKKLSDGAERQQSAMDSDPDDDFWEDAESKGGRKGDGA
ncbi:MAG: ribosome biogenesis GTPase Der [Fibrobacteres bacterium]|jgi:GTP-binding protein|nr:ribosome biogenesis GTPase Der [Fibrobacterota bacterium]